MYLVIAALPIEISPSLSYSIYVLWNYEHKRAHNNRIGPGGGTRRLHQNPFIWRLRGRNRIDERVKGLALFRRDTTVSVQNVQLQMTIVLQWRWPRKRPELLKT